MYIVVVQLAWRYYAFKNLRASQCREVFLPSAHYMPKKLLLLTRFPIRGQVEPEAIAMPISLVVLLCSTQNIAASSDIGSMHEVSNQQPQIRMDRTRLTTVIAENLLHGSEWMWGTS